MAQLLSVRAAAVALCFTTLSWTARVDGSFPSPVGTSQTAWWRGPGCCKRSGGGRSNGDAISKLKGDAYMTDDGCVDGCAAKATELGKVLWAIDYRETKKGLKICTCYYEPQNSNQKKGNGCTTGTCLGLEVESTAPSSSPSAAPSSAPTKVPTYPPTNPPSNSPSESPSSNPSSSPSSAPSSSPSVAPSSGPSSSPSEAPSSNPSSSPSSAPSTSSAPSATPSTSPSMAPTATPSSAPSCSFALMPVTDAITWGVLEELDVPYTNSDLYFLGEQGKSTGFDQFFPAHTDEPVQNLDHVFEGYQAQGGCRHTYRNDTMNYTEIVDVKSHKRKPFTLAKCKHECMMTPWCTGIQYQGGVPCTQSNLVSMTEINTCNEGCKRQGKCPTGKGKTIANPCLLFKTPNINAAEIALKIKKKKTTIRKHQARCFKKLCVNEQLDEQLDDFKLRSLVP